MKLNRRSFIAGAFGLPLAAPALALHQSTSPPKPNAFEGMTAFESERLYPIRPFKRVILDIDSEASGSAVIVNSVSGERLVIPLVPGHVKYFADLRSDISGTFRIQIDCEGAPFKLHNYAFEGQA